MKILQVIDSLPHTSGGARFVVNLSKNLVLRGMDVHVLLIDGKKSHFLDELEASNITLIVLDENTPSRYRPKYVRKIATTISKYDIVHVHVFPSSYIVAFASLFTNIQVPLLFTEHATFNRRATHPIFKYLEKFMYGRFSKVVGITAAVKVFVQNHLGVAEDKIEVIDNGVDLDTIINSPSANRSEFNIEKDDIVLLMAARFADEKDHVTVMRALVSLPQNFKLLFAGDGPNLKLHKKTAEELGVLSRVNFLGARSDIYQIIKMSDINILSSHFEGFGLSAVEAMAASKPVIATNVPGLSDVVGGAGLLFNVGDYEILNSLILQLGTNVLFYKEVSQRCLERSKSYSIEVMTDRYVKVFHNIINEYTY